MILTEDKTKDLAQMLREDLSSEIDAIYGYEKHAQLANDPLIKETLIDIANEEKKHMGELITLLAILEPDTIGLFNDGEHEVKSKAKKWPYAEFFGENKPYRRIE